MSDTMMNIIVIGGDHHNTLAVIRCLGIYEYKYTVLIHENKHDQECMCSKSKYAVGNTYVVENSQNAILDWLIKNKSVEKQIIFPCSDLSAYVVDKYNNRLCKYYFVPGFGDKSGLIDQLMDKYKQYLFALNNGVNSAKTWKISLSEINDEVYNEITFPCIIKPIISAEGNKTDIKILQDSSHIIPTLNEFKIKGYKSVIIQEYIRYDRQLLACGTILQNSRLIVGTIFEKVREAANGSTAYGVVTNNENAIKLNKKVCNSLLELGYSGHYDIEYFEKGNVLYLNEINFRHSGAGCILLDYGVLTPIYWCKDVTNCLDVNTIKQPIKTARFMSEVADIYNIQTKKISFFKWVFDFIFTHSHTIWNSHDVPGALAFYKPVFTVIRHKIRDIIKF